MAQSRDESQLPRIELVVLGCLSQSKPPSDAELGDALQQLALPREPADAARQRAVALVSGLVRRGWVDSPSRKLTEGGRRALRTAFELARTPTWTQVRDKHLPARAVGVAPGSELAAQACTEAAITAAVLAARLGVSGAKTPTAVCDAVITDALGMPRGTKLTLERMRAHVLSRAIDRNAIGVPAPGGKGSYFGRLAAWIASIVVGATGSQRKMARAIARRWVCGEVDVLGAGSSAVSSTSVAPVPTGTGPLETVRGAAQPAQGPTPPLTPPSLPPDTITRPIGNQLLQVVRDAIPRVGAEGRFGEKVYVSAIWRSIERDKRAGDLSLDHFKRWLVSANRDGWLVLARADLVGAMDAKQVTESEINDRGATFHFVLDQRNASAAAQRETHAG